MRLVLPKLLFGKRLDYHHSVVAIVRRMNIDLLTPKVTPKEIWGNARSLGALFLTPRDENTKTINNGLEIFANREVPLKLNYWVYDFSHGLLTASQEVSDIRDTLLTYCKWSVKHSSMHWESDIDRLETELSEWNMSKLPSFDVTFEKIFGLRLIIPPTGAEYERFKIIMHVIPNEDHVYKAGGDPRSARNLLYNSRMSSQEDAIDDAFVKAAEGVQKNTLLW